MDLSGEGMTRARRSGTGPETSALRGAVDDSELVQRARQGDERAFAELVRRHETQARALAASIVGDRAEAEDLAQDAFVRAHGNLDLLSDPTRFGAWFRRIVFGVSIDWLRRFRPQLFRGGGEHPESNDLPETSSLTPDGLDRLAHAELAARVLAAVRQLPDHYRVPLTMYHLEGLSHAKVAEALGVPPGTARSLVSRARQRLRRLLEPYAREALELREPTEDVFEERPMPRLLHILNGDSTAGLLRETGLPGTLAVWADALHDGPVPSIALGSDGFRATRARFIAETGWASYEEALRTQTEWDRGVERFAEFDEAVIWCEHDLFDQLLLARHLAWFADRELGAAGLSLICIGEYPGMPAFKGLGELEPDHLASLFGTRQRVSQRQLELGRRAWRAFTSPDPRAVERFLADEDATPLPFLAGALRRHLEEFPSVRNGLSRTEQQILDLVMNGTTELGKLFPAVHARETQFYIADASFLARLRRLAGGSHPLVRLDEGQSPRWWEGRAGITDVGRAVLGGREDWVRLNGLDLWLGGVHLVGADAEWRWDGESGRLSKT